MVANLQTNVFAGIIAIIFCDCGEYKLRKNMIIVQIVIFVDSSFFHEVVIKKSTLVKDVFETRGASFRVIVGAIIV